MMMQIKKKLLSVGPFNNFSPDQRIIAVALHILVLILFTLTYAWAIILDFDFVVTQGLNIHGMLFVYTVLVSPWKRVREHTWNEIVRPFAHFIANRIADPIDPNVVATEKERTRVKQEQAVKDVLRDAMLEKQAALTKDIQIDIDTSNQYGEQSFQEQSRSAEMANPKQDNHNKPNKKTDRVIKITVDGK